MITWALAVLALVELAVAATLVRLRDPEYLTRALAFWVPAGVGGVGIAHFETGSWRTAVLVPVAAFAVGLVATRFRPGHMFRLAEAEQSSDAEVRAAARKAGWRLAIELAVLGLAAYVLLALTHAV